MIRSIVIVSDNGQIEIPWSYLRRYDIWDEPLLRMVHLGLGFEIPEEVWTRAQMDRLRRIEDAR